MKMTFKGADPAREKSLVPQNDRNKTGNFCCPALCRAGKPIGLVHRFVKAFETWLWGAL